MEEVVRVLSACRSRHTTSHTTSCGTPCHISCTCCGSVRHAGAGDALSIADRREGVRRIIAHGEGGTRAVDARPRACGRARA